MAAVLFVISLVLVDRAKLASSWKAVFPVALAAVLTGSLAWAGHGAATPGAIGDVHLAADVLHLVVAGLWIGGLIPLAFMLFVARRGDAVWIARAGEATQRFSALALVSVLLLLLSGMVNALVLVGSVSALTETLYGRFLLAKIGLFLLMLGFATVNRFRLTPRITADAVAGLEQPRRITGRLARNSVYEFALGLVVLTIVGVLGTLPPASHSHLMPRGTIWKITRSPE